MAKVLHRGNTREKLTASDVVKAGVTISVVKKLAGRGKSTARKPPANIVIGRDGKRRTVYTIDAESKNFGEEFGYAFAQSVRRARKENIRVIGRPDLAVKKR